MTSQAHYIKSMNTPLLTIEDSSRYLNKKPTRVDYSIMNAGFNLNQNNKNDVEMANAPRTYPDVSYNMPIPLVNNSRNKNLNANLNDLGLNKRFLHQNDAPRNDAYFILWDNQGFVEDIYY